MASNDELACTYAALILADDQVPITGDKIQTILKAAKVEVEAYWPSLFARALEGVNVRDLITNIGNSAGSASAASGPAPAAAATAAPVVVAAKKEEKEEKKKDESEDSGDDMGFGVTVQSKPGRAVLSTVGTLALFLAVAYMALWQ